jgi:hypothetical protein
MKISVINDSLYVETPYAKFIRQSDPGSKLLNAYLMNDHIIVHQQFETCDELVLINEAGNKLGSISSLTSQSEQFSSFVQIKPLQLFKNLLLQAVGFNGDAYIADFKKFELRIVGFTK